MSRTAAVLVSLLVLAPAFAVLVGLGTWQTLRLQEKTALLQSRAASFAAEPVALPTAGADLADAAWRRVHATGTFDHGREFHLWRLRDGEPGYAVLTAFAPTPGDGDRREPPILVERGWVPVDRKNPAARAAGQIAGEVAVTGFLRTDLDARNALTPPNEPDRNLWYWVDYDAMDARDGAVYRRAVLVADATANPGGYPVGAAALPHISNNHLQYAITWYGLAAALVVVSALAARRAARRARSPAPPPR